MKINVVTLFPEMFEAITEHGITRRSISNGLIEIEFYNPRDYTKDVHRTVDNRPYGGGPGMVMMMQPLHDAISAASKNLDRNEKKAHKVCLTPQGRKLDQKGLKELSDHEHLILVAGRYEGIDERVLQEEIDEEWSIGDYVISGGELAAMVVIDGLIRMIPGALGHEDSAIEDSFYDGLLDYPHYTRPDDENVPAVLLSGNHADIKTWRLKQALGRTWLRRPDLLTDRVLTTEEQNLLDEFIREQSLPDLE
ncbi:MAG: tRNA (guanosine(37)-N1)-methyltransferase TrmD [Gammaproteobacteria bacterium]